MLVLLPFLPSPSIRFPLRCLLRCHCSYAATPSSSIAPYHQSFARRMALAGIHPHHRIAVGVSGGPDSMALCVLAASWKKACEIGSGRKPGEETPVSLGFVDGLLGVVVDHALRPESADEAQLVRDRVHNMGVMCEIARCEWPDGRPKLGHLQESAREMRYQKLLDICIKQQIGVLLIAHHSDDQAELFVLRLSRNSGVLGLAGTAFVSQLFAPNLKYDGHNFSRYGILLVRPMLEFSKDDMYKICEGSNSLWVEDPTNNSMMYARNRIRASLRCLSTEDTFQSELQKLICACRLTRACVENACSIAVKQSVTVTEYGYAVIDLEKFDPRNVEDLFLSQYLTYILQFVSQRHRPIRGGSARLFMDYIRSTPCKLVGRLTENKWGPLWTLSLIIQIHMSLEKINTLFLNCSRSTCIIHKNSGPSRRKGALSVAGCYICTFPRSRGTKVLVCCSVDWMESSAVEMSYKCSYKEQPPPVPEIDQIVLEARLYSNRFLQCSNIPFASSKSSIDLLKKAKDLNVIGSFTSEKLFNLQTEEHKKFTTTKHKLGEQYLEKISFHDTNILCLWPGETCHFMSRFLITWNALEVLNGECLHDSQKHLCQQCVVNQEKCLAVRHMLDTDWLFLAEVSKIHPVEGDKNGLKVSINRLEDDEFLRHSRYIQLSATKSLEILRPIPASARRTLPVVTNSQGDILSIPSIGFRCCPSLSIKAVFHPTVPLGGGFASYV